MPKIKMNSNDNVDVNEVFDKFIRYKKLRKLSEATIDFYERNTKSFFDFLQENGISEIDKVSEETIDNYIFYLEEKLDNVTTINTYLRSTRVFLYYCMKNSYIENFKIKLLKEEDKIKEVYTNEQLNILLKKPDLKECNFAHYRNWVITNYLLSTGNRSRTIRNIIIKDLDLLEGYVKLSTMKNKKQQIIPLSKTMVEILREYLNYRDGEDDDYLFCTEFGEKLTRAGLYQAIRRYNLKRGVDKTSLHLYRNTFAKMYIQKGGDIFKLQKLLNHKSLEMVEKYLDFFGEDLKENYDKLNPLEQLQNNKDHIKL